MVLWITWCITENVFSQAICPEDNGSLAVDSFSNQLRTGPAPPWPQPRPPYLQVIGVVVRPRQQHGGEQVPGPHEDGVHLVDLHPDPLRRPAAVGTN